MKGSKQSFIGNVCIAVFLLISAGFILYIANVSPTFKSQIELQKHNKKYFDNLDEEKLSIVKSRKLFEKRETTDNSMLLREIGPIPDGKFVSSFKGEGEGTHIYHEKYRAYGKRAIYYVDKEPRRNYDGSLVRDYFGDVMYEEVEKVRYVTEPYWAYEPKEVPFKYAYSLTTFDLSDSISSNAPDSVYEKLTQQFAIQLGSYKNYKFSPSLWKCNNNNDWDTWYGKTLPKNRQAIAYVAKDQQGVSVLRYVFFANQRAYMLEMHSEYQLESKAKRILESVTSFYLQDYNDMVDKKLLFVVLGSFLFVVLGLACLLIPKLSLRRKGISMPTSEKWLCRYIYVAWLVNVVCVFADIYSVYTGEIKQDGSWWSYFLLFLCAVGMNIYTNAYIINKVKVEHGFDYFVPKWLKAYLVNRHVTDAEYKSVVVFLLYPFFILGNLPLGLCVLCYVLPVSLLSMVLLGFEISQNGAMVKGKKIAN